MEFEIVILDAWDPVERDVEQAVQDEPDNVEGDKVKVEPDDALPPPVLVDLRVEGDGPGDEVDPAEDVADHVQGLGDGHSGQDEGTLCVDTDSFVTEGCDIELHCGPG